MPDSTRDATRTKSLGWVMWIAQGLFGIFFLNVVLERHWPGLVEISPAAEAGLLVLATSCFITGCLKFERRQVNTD